MKEKVKKYIKDEGYEEEDSGDGVGQRSWRNKNKGEQELKQQR